MTRAKDISKIVTDADLSGTLDVTGEVTTANDIKFTSGSRHKFVGGGTGNNLELGTYSSSNTSRDVHLEIDSAGNVGINTSSPSLSTASGSASGLEINGTVPAINLKESSGNDEFLLYGGASSATIYTVNNLRFLMSGSEKMRLTTGGNVGIGVVPNSSWHSTLTALQIGGNASLSAQSSVGASKQAYFSQNVFNDGDQKYISTDQASNYYQGDGKHVFQVASSGSANAVISWNTALTVDNSGKVGLGIDPSTLPSFISHAMKIVNGGGLSITSPSSSDNRYIFFGTGTSSSDVQLAAIKNSSSELMFLGASGAERMRITSGGEFLVGKTSNSHSTAGFGVTAGGIGNFVVDANLSLILNRYTNDGTLVSFRQDHTQEGSISVSGTTVSYNGGHLSRWSQLTDNTRDNTIVKGTVMTNLDQMAEWTTDGVTEDNEQLNCMAVSSVEGDANVAGVFVNWDNDDDIYTNDMNVAMTGDMVIRIAQGTTVARGDLLMSAGDGTAKPQGDDIVRSKTIAKVTSTNVSHTYDDGTYLVPCVLMAC